MPKSDAYVSVRKGWKQFPNVRITTRLEETLLEKARDKKEQKDARGEKPEECVSEEETQIPRHRDCQEQVARNREDISRMKSWFLRSMAMCIISLKLPSNPSRLYFSNWNPKTLLYLPLGFLKVMLS